MGLSREQIDAHPFSAALSSVEERLGQVGTPDDSEVMAAVDRVKKVVQRTRGIVKSTDPDLVTSEMVDALAEPLGYIDTDLTAFLADGDKAQLAEAESDVDSLLNALGTWPAPRGKFDAEVAQRAFETAKESGLSLIRALEEQTQSLRAELDQLKNRSTEVKSAQGELISDLEERLDGLKGTIDSERVRLDSFITKAADGIQQTKEGHRDENQEFLEQQAEHFKEALEKRIASAEAAQEALQAKADGVLEQLATLQEKAEDAVGAIGVIGVTGGFQRYANAQRKAADAWNWVVVGSLAAIVGIGIFLLSGDDNLDLTRYLSKALLTLPLVGLAAYAGRQAHNHRVKEARARRFELEAGALDAYIVHLPEENRDELKVEMARRLFGQPEVADHAPHGLEKGAVGAVNDLLNTVLEFVKRSRP